MLNDCVSKLRWTNIYVLITNAIVYKMGYLSVCSAQKEIDVKKGKRNVSITYRTTCLCRSTQYLMALRTMISCFLLKPFGLAKFGGTLNVPPHLIFVWKKEERKDKKCFPNDKEISSNFVYLNGSYSALGTNTFPLSSFSRSSSVSVCASASIKLSRGKNQWKEIWMKRKEKYKWI